MSLKNTPSEETPQQFEYKVQDDHKPTYIVKGDFNDIFDRDRLFRYIFKICENHNIDLSREEINAIVKATHLNLSDYIPHKKFVELMCKITEHLKLANHNYSKLSTILYVDHIHRYTAITFSDFISIMKSTKIIDPMYINFIEKYSIRLDKMVKNHRDYLYTYLGLLVLEQQNYLNKVDGKIVERPQYMHMRVAVNIFAGRYLQDVENGEPQDDNKEMKILRDIQNYYEKISLLEFTNATPTLFNSCSAQSQLNSCFLTGLSDSTEGIMDNLKHHALISKNSGGIGTHVDNIRPSGSYIAGSGGRSGGLIRQLKQYDAAALCWDQGGGKRNAAFSIYIQLHHGDILDFLDMKVVGGLENNRCRSLFPGLFICDLFIKRVRGGESWSLFDTSDNSPCAELSYLYGDAYEAAYIKHEKDGRAIKTMPAVKLFEKIANSLASTSSLYICFKDHVNNKSNQKNIGTIKSSNLCTEIMEYSDHESYASCTLASVILKSYVDSSKFDYKKLYDNVKLIVRALDNVIDINKYPVKECIKNANDYRPIGIGIQGLADVFMALRIPFLSKAAELIDRQIAETMYYAALEASYELAQERGAYARFEGSPVSEGILQFDMWKKDLGEMATPTNMYNWDTLREKCKKGIRNSLLIAHMPTVSTANICGSTECFEPITNNIFIRSTLSGKYLYINNYLQQHLVDLGLWDKLYNKIVTSNGSIADINEIPNDVKEIYKTVYELDNRELHRRAAIRATMIDQSSSLNLYSETIDANIVAAAILNTHSLGLKTGIYYYRGKTKAEAMKNNESIKRYLKIDLDLLNSETDGTDKKELNAPTIPDNSTQDESGPICRMEEGCVMCSS